MRFKLALGRAAEDRLVLRPVGEPPRDADLCEGRPRARRVRLSRVVGTRRCTRWRPRGRFASIHRRRRWRCSRSPVAANDLGGVCTLRDDAFDALVSSCARRVRSSTSVIDRSAGLHQAQARPAEGTRGLSQAEPGGDAAPVAGRDPRNQLVFPSPAARGWSRRCSSPRGIVRRASHRSSQVGGHAPVPPIHPAIPETRYLKTLTCRVVHD